MEIKSTDTKQEKSLIANPIYDYVFKYLMEDSPSAIKLISAIINEEITELSFAPQEYVKEIDATEKSHSVYRLDFIARIGSGENSKVVMIEVQKVSLHTDIMRFRRYLGGQYQNQKNSYKDSRGVIHAMPIYCIFFLGEGAGEGVENIPVVKVTPAISDVTTGRLLTRVNNEFIKSLHHHSWIVQVPALTGHRRNELEILLSIFDQTNKMNNPHILNINEKNFPTDCRPIIRRLQAAAVNQEVREAMQLEDDILEHLRIEERMAQIKFEKIISEKDAALSEKDAVISEKDAVISEKDAVISEKDAALSEKDAVISEKDAALARERAEKIALENLVAEFEKRLNQQ
jgi:hypothetical protein